MVFEGRIGHLEGIESPWGNAGGVVKTIEDVEQMAHTGVGWIEDGSHTLDKRLGNGWNPETKQRDKKDWDFNPNTGEMHNSLGMPGVSFDDLEKELPEKNKIAHAHKKALILNVAPVSGEPAEESLELIQRGYAAGVDGVILNAGCPNVKDESGNMHDILSLTPKLFEKVLYFIADQGIPKPIWVRISPQGSSENSERAANIIRNSGIVSAVLTPNTWTVPMPIKQDGSNLLDIEVPRVGKSGPAMREEAALELYYMEYFLRGSGIDTISSSSIMDAKELQLRLDLGAVAGAGTTFFYESQNGWKDDTDRLLNDLVG